MQFLLSEGLQNFFQQLALKEKIRSTEFTIKKITYKSFDTLFSQKFRMREKVYLFGIL